MKSKSIVILLFILLMVNCFISVNKLEYYRADILPKFYVDDDYDSTTPGWQIDHFDSIQDAIDASNSGDRIVVYAGTYNENLVITHSLDIFGEERNTTFIDGGDTADVINISSKYVNISHFTIGDSGNNEENASVLINSGNAIITDNIITSSKQGISISNCDNSIIYDNIIKSNLFDDNYGRGISFFESQRNIIVNNNIINSIEGIYFWFNSNGNYIENNEIYSNNKGIYLGISGNNNILSNKVIDNRIGINIGVSSKYNSIKKNIIEKNYDGIHLEDSSNSIISNNQIKENKRHGIQIDFSLNNIVTENDFNFSGIFSFSTLE